jgi:putative endonuclease
MPRKKKKRAVKKIVKRIVHKKRIFLRKAQFHVYMLECSDGSFYTGYTNDLEKRVILHNKGGGSKYVRTRRPARLVYCKQYRYYKLAITEERRLKRLSRPQKETMVRIYHKEIGVNDPDRIWLLCLCFKSSCEASVHYDI